MCAAARKFSKYFNELDGTAKKRYLEKLHSVGENIDDPYTLNWKETPAADDLWPSIEYPDIYNYLVNTPSPYTKEELKAYKSLDGYKYLVSGWVGNVSVHTVLPGHDYSKLVLTAVFRHSQAVSATHLLPWVAAEKCGTIISAHCTCMAGLGEASSHIAALLFAALAHTEMMKNTSCTSLPCSWLSPRMVNVDYAPIARIDFSTPSTKRKKVTQEVSSEVTEFIDTPSPSEDELKMFYDDLAQSKTKPAILSIISGYAEKYKVDQNVLSLPLSSLFQSDCLQMPYTDLLVKCEDVFQQLMITEQQCKNIEASTRTQAHSKLWFRFRAGRVTASKFKAACHTDLSQPSPSLVKSICYTENCRFTTTATQWGCDHEKTARKEYLEQQQHVHVDLTVEDKGLVISHQYPYLGASPDGYVECACCGPRVLEIKCPFSCRDKPLLEATSDNSFCLEVSPEGTYILKPKHSYYYQVQLQMKLCNVAYCDFVVWKEEELVILRIDFEENFVKDAIEKCTKFYKYGVLPELIGKWYTIELTQFHHSNQKPQVPHNQQKKPKSGAIAMKKNQEK